MLTMATALVLVCLGGGTATKPDDATITGDVNAWISMSRQQGFTDQVDIRLDGNGGTIRFPRSLVPPLRGGSDGWFDIRDLQLTDRTITGKAALNFINKPRIHIDRMTGTIRITGMNGDYYGQCAKLDPEAERRF